MRRGKPHYGPPDASYEIRLDGKPHASTSGMRRQTAYDELRYWRESNRTAELVRIEMCVQPGCRGFEPVIERRVRGRMFPVHAPCVHHTNMCETVEARSSEKETP